MQNTGTFSLKSAILAIVLFLPIAAIAETADDNAETAASEQQNSGISVFSGGIGDDDMAHIKQIQHKYSTKILFTAAGGEYLSDINVTVNDQHGRNVVTTVTKGPVLLLDLPAGSYKLSASRDDSMTRTLTIKVVGHTLNSYQIRYPAAAE